MANAVSGLKRGLSWRDLLVTLAIIGFFYVSIRFLSAQLPNLTSHGDIAWAYVLHVLGGVVVLALGPFQFVRPIRDRFRRYHRWAGYAFVAGSLAAFVGFLALMPSARDTFLPSQATAMGLWMLAMFAAVVAARRKHFLTHRHNMTRAFVIATYFIIVRVIDPWGMQFIGPWLGSSEDAALAHSDWLAWIVPLLFVELYYGVKWDRLVGRSAKPS